MYPLGVCWVLQEVPGARDELEMRTGCSTHDGCACQRGTTNMMSALSRVTLFSTTGMRLKGGKA